MGTLAADKATNEPKQLNTSCANTQEANNLCRNEIKSWKIRQITDKGAKTGIKIIGIGVMNKSVTTK